MCRPVEYTFTVDGTLDPDTEGGDLSADSDEDVYRPTRDAYFRVKDETGPVPENAGGTTYLGDRYRFSGTVEEFDPDYDPSRHDVYVYLDEQDVDPDVVRNDEF